MRFIELEELMSTRGVNTLANIARVLNTTPQAVSNWKSRDQVPYHIVSKIKNLSNNDNTTNSSNQAFSSKPYISDSNIMHLEEDTLSLSDILLVIVQQLKVIVLTVFIFVFITITHVQFIEQPKYISWAKVLIPSNNTGNLGGLSGLASQFGVNVPSGTNADLSSPSLFPELLKSRTFAETLLDKEFYTEKYNKKLSLLALLTYGDNPSNVDKEILITNAISTLRGMTKISTDLSTSFSVIEITASEPLFAKELLDVVLSELEQLNRFFKSKNVSEKTSFIENRIASVEDDLNTSELKLKDFNEQNRQISSPALQLDLERLSRDVEIQRGIYLTLKQQLELAKIEEVQQATIMQVLDTPQVPLGPSNKNLKFSFLLAVTAGLGCGIFFGFVRSYTNNSDINERKKIRRIKNFINKKSIDFLYDNRVTGIISLLMFFGLPYYLGYESKEPVFFNMYSSKLMFINTVYLLLLIMFSSFFIISTIKKNKPK